MVVSLLKKREFALNDKITVKIPTIGEYRGSDDNSCFNQLDYDLIMQLFIITPSNKMVELFDCGIDFRNVSEYDFFIQLFYSEFIRVPVGGEKRLDSTLIFKDIDFAQCHIGNVGDQNVIVDKKGSVLIDEIMYMRLSSLFCEILNTKKYRRKPGDNTAYKFIIEREREKLKRLKRKKGGNSAELDELIIALVCDCNFPYDFDGVDGLTLYDFNCCVRQIIKRVNYNNIMMGVYSGFGTVDIKKIKSSELNFLSYK